MNIESFAIYAAAACNYTVLGMMLMMRLDASARWYRLLDRLSPAAQILTTALWPVALPFVMVRYGRHRY